MKYIKAWDENSKTMVEDILTLSQRQILTDFSTIADLDNIKLTWLFPTGVKDINKKEIYKGDILKNITSHRIWIVDYKDAAFIMSYENRNIELLYDYVRNGTMDNFEIVGNIFENKDLIKKEV